MTLTDQELATVLAALRAWQQQNGPMYPPADLRSYFDTVAPLTSDEIDDLCERLNTDSN